MSCPSMSLGAQPVAARRCPWGQAWMVQVGLLYFLFADDVSCQRLLQWLCLPAFCHASCCDDDGIFSFWNCHRQINPSFSNLPL